MVIEIPASENEPNQIVGAARMSKLHGSNSARFTLLIADAFQGKGLGFEMIDRLIAVARSEGLERIEAIFSTSSSAMQHMLEKNKFTFSAVEEGKIHKAELAL
jgi:acetyltransferase